MRLIDVRQLKEIAEVVFADIVQEAIIPDINELRIFLHEGSFVDVWYSLKLQDRFSFHWERRAIDGTIYLHDNAPHQRWKGIATFPLHFHNGDELNVVESHLNNNSTEALREFLTFVRAIINRNKGETRDAQNK